VLLSPEEEMVDNDRVRRRFEFPANSRSFCWHRESKTRKREDSTQEVSVRVFRRVNTWLTPRICSTFVQVSRRELRTLQTSSVLTQGRMPSKTSHHRRERDS